MRIQAFLTAAAVNLKRLAAALLSFSPSGRGSRLPGRLGCLLQPDWNPTAPDPDARPTANLPPSQPGFFNSPARQRCRAQ
jgi:hypothetical protein